MYCWVIENIDEATARRLHVALLADAGYFGMHAVDLTNAVHLALYRNSLVSTYRIKGRSCHLFFSMGDEGGNDLSEPDELRRLGFKVVDWEDSGAHGTGLDHFDTLEHFERVEDFRSLVSLNAPGGENQADELVLMLEDLSPRLFSTLGACARALKLSAHEEDLAQAGLSARRYLEQLADALFPSRDTPFKGRSVTHEKYKNRLWAYIDSSIPDDDIAKGERLAALGKEVDRLIKEVNATLHGTSNKNRLSQSLSDIAALSAALLQLNPEEARKPYFAFHANIIHFIEEAARGMRSDE